MCVELYSLKKKNCRDGYYCLQLLYSGILNMGQREEGVCVFCTYITNTTIFDSYHHYIHATMPLCHYNSRLRGSSYVIQYSTVCKELMMVHYNTDWSTIFQVMITG